MAMTERHFKDYQRVQKNEKVEIQVVFVRWNEYDQANFYWETLDNLKNSIIYKEKYDIKYLNGRVVNEMCLFWDTNSLRRELWNIGLQQGLEEQYR